MHPSHGGGGISSFRPAEPARSGLVGDSVIVLRGSFCVAVCIMLDLAYVGDC